MSIEVVTGEAPPLPRRGRAARALGPLAMALFALGLWLRGQPAFVAWQLAVDHQRCFGRRQLPARVWSPDPAEIRDWLEGAHAHAALPGRLAAERRGARYVTVTRVAAHVHYGGEARIVGLPAIRPGSHRRHSWHGLRLRRLRGRLHAGGRSEMNDVTVTARAFEVTVGHGADGRVG
jgi:hypothetical protein